MVMIRVVASCRVLMPVISEGGIILKETWCILPKNHAGPHRSAEGGTLVNQERDDFEIEMGRPLKKGSA